MTYGTIVRVRAPIDAYDATYAEVMKAEGPQLVPGFILHIGRATEDGFEIIEVSHDRYSRPADSDRDYTLVSDEPGKRVR